MSFPSIRSRAGFTATFWCAQCTRSSLRQCKSWLYPEMLCETPAQMTRLRAASTTASERARMSAVTVARSIQSWISRIPFNPCKAVECDIGVMEDALSNLLACPKRKPKGFSQRHDFTRNRVHASHQRHPQPSTTLSASVTSSAAEPYSDAIDEIDLAWSAI